MNKFVHTLKNQKSKILALSITASALPITVFAVDPVVPDVASSITTSLNSVVTNTLGAITAVAPIGITIFGAMFAWKKGVQFFKGVAK